MTGEELFRSVTERVDSDVEAYDPDYNMRIVTKKPNVEINKLGYACVGVSLVLLVFFILA